MKRWQLLVGAGLLIVLASSWVALRSAAATAAARVAEEQQRAAQQLVPPKPFLEVGKNYNILIAHRNDQPIEKCEVMEQPRDGWVKVRVREGNFEKVTVAWVNLNQITFIVPLPEDK